MKRTLILLAVVLAVGCSIAAEAGGRVMVTDRDTDNARSLKGCARKLGLTLEVVSANSDLIADLGVDPKKADQRQAVATLRPGGWVVWTDSTLTDECSNGESAWAKVATACRIRDAQVKRVEPTRGGMVGTCSDGTGVQFTKCGGSR